MIYRLNKKFSDDGEIRTPKPKGHYHLKVACLPISPHRQKRLVKLPIIYLLANNYRTQKNQYNGFRNKRKINQEIT